MNDSAERKVVLIARAVGASLADRKIEWTLEPWADGNTCNVRAKIGGPNYIIQLKDSYDPMAWRKDGEKSVTIGDHYANPTPTESDKYVFDLLQQIKNRRFDPKPVPKPVAASEPPVSVAGGMPPGGSTRTYANSQWGFWLEHPTDWELLWENDPAGSWLAAVGIAGSRVSGGRPGLIVNVRRGSVLAEHTDGGVRVVNIGAPSTVQEFVDQSVATLAGSFTGFKLLTKIETELAGKPSVRMAYTYDARNASNTRMQESSVTRFGKDTFQITCEAPAADFGKVEPVFQSIIDSFRFQSAPSTPAIATPDTNAAIAALVNKQKAITEQIVRLLRDGKWNEAVETERAGFVPISLVKALGGSGSDRTEESDRKLALDRVRKIAQEHGIVEPAGVGKAGSLQIGTPRKPWWRFWA